LLLFGLATVAMMVRRRAVWSRTVIHGDPRERKSISGALVKEGHG
jgi:hypothetical protein